MTLPIYQVGAVHRFIAGKLEAVERGDIKRLMLFLPPRTGKTELLMRWLAWCLGRHPDWPMLYTSYGADLAWEKSGETRNIVDGEEYAGIFGALSTVDEPVALARDSRSVQRWRIAGRRGGLQAQGVGGPLTGKGGIIVVVDDPCKNREEADSATFRERTWKWYTSTLRTRLESAGRIVLCMTRWHEDDLAGRLLRRAAEDPLADQWQIVSLPALAQPDDPLGRQPGQALDPARADEAYLAQTRASIGSRDWAAMYEQQPRPDAGNVFKREWLTTVAQLPELSRVVVAWDTAFESKEQSDFSVAMLVGQGVDGRYIVAVLVHARLEFPELVQATKTQIARWPQAEHIVEAKASGKSLRQALRAEGIPLIEVEPAGDKVARANAITRFFEAGMVTLLDGAGVDALIHELLSFPNGTHDDQVDALVYGLARCAGGTSGIWV